MSKHKGVSDQIKLSCDQLFNSLQISLNMERRQ